MVSRKKDRDVIKEFIKLPYIIDDIVSYVNNKKHKITVDNIIDIRPDWCTWKYNGGKGISLYVTYTTDDVDDEEFLCVYYLDKTPIYREIKLRELLKNNK